ncbi:MAG: ATP-binding protein [Pseudomonadales bacterium]|nr:ATP-binding protein [Pseudomonadales bacterium]
MRQLAITVYALIVGVFLMAVWVVDYFDEDLYKKEITSEYIEHTELLVSLLAEKLNARPLTLQQALMELEQYYDDVSIAPIGSEMLSSSKLSFVPLGKPVIDELDISTKTDSVYVAALVKAGPEKIIQLEFEFIDSYSDEYMAFHGVSSVLVFLIVGALVSALVYYFYRYLHSIGEVTHSVVKGNYDQTMPHSRFHALQTISHEINDMSQALKNNAEENTVFLGALHHELRIPITRLRLALDMALINKDESNLKPLIQDMDQDLDQLIILSEQMLSLARLSMEASPLPTHSIDLGALVENIAHAYDDQRIVVTIDTNRSQWEIVLNEAAVERSLSNIIGNAVKYAVDSVRVRTVCSADSWQVIVEDDGVGIPDDELEQVIKPFYRVDKSRSDQKAGGYGLGLAIANILIRKTGGSLTLSRSTLGGLRADIVWPLAP